MAKIFLTGASGFIGGHVLQLLAESHPEYTIRALVRDASKSQPVAAVSEKVQVIEASLDDVETISREAADADIVLHLAATGHFESVKAIHKGLSARVAAGQKPAHWIQISGASALGAAEIADASRAPGSPSDAVFDDVDGLDELKSFIEKHPGRAVDNYVLSVSKQTPLVKTALLFGPIIYGEGKGPVNQRSVQVPTLAKQTLSRKRGLQAGSGLSRWGNIHVADLSRLIQVLVEDAAGGKDTEQAWGSNGVYLAGVGELTFGEISKRVATAAKEQGFNSTDEVDQLDAEESNKQLPHGAVLFGTNARGSPRRAKEVLRWTPREAGIDVEIPRAVAAEAKALAL